MTQLEQVRRDLRLSSREAVFSSIMTGSGETYLPAFALAAGLSESTAGMVAAFPFLAGSVIQLASPAALRRTGSYRKWVVLCAALQALCFLPLAYSAVVGSISAFWFFAVVSLYWAFGLATGPAWTSWMSATIPEAERTGYLARRSRAAQIGLLAGLLGSGILLQEAKIIDRELLAFAGVFIIAFVFRMISTLSLNMQTDRSEMMSGEKKLSFGEVFKKIRHGQDARLLVFLMIFQLGVNVAAPYFNPFILRHLHCNYTEYMGLIAAAYLAKVILFPRLSGLTKEIGPERLLKLGVLGAAFLPLMWLISDNYVFLLAAQVLSGVFWAIVEFASVLVFFEKLKNCERTAFLCIYNVMNAVALFTGTLLGAGTLHFLGESTVAYFVLFGFSSVARFICCVLLEKWVFATEASSEAMGDRATDEPAKGESKKTAVAISS